MHLIPGMRQGLLAIILAAPAVAQSSVPEEQVARLDGPELTCMGAERAGGPDGVAAYTGKWAGTWPGQTRAQGYEPGPYAAEKPLFKITRDNMAQYDAMLSDGTKALLEAYPQTFWMNVYPSHRDFRPPQWACDAARHNAAHAELKDDGLSVTGVGGGPAFPMPQSGAEAMRSVQTTFRSWTEKAELDIAVVYSGGEIAWGRNKLMTMSPMNAPGDKRPSLTEKISAYFLYSTLLPERDRGLVSVGFQLSSFKDGSTQAWQYQPGTRRVRQAPEVGFDYPVPPAGLHTSDEDSGFNGSPERYTWTLIGKKTLVVPYNNFGINDPALRYKDLIKPDSINPEHVRYEAHRVWVVEGDLKPGMRHVYSKRRVYIDEDTWLIVSADEYDNRGQLWRVPMILYFYSQASGAFHRGVQVFHDLTAHAYEANNLLNERDEDDWWRINTPMSPTMFTPDAAARAGR
ncbi:DUF1329 domain-containing protein [Sinimarinibacterium sp. CAU 1509]|uniref:DUF1329 domain-containing protein n=1 Tax=Sinimarinibacterium sp. CAU 1509 TaxID=2562283 RepID=UPI00200B73DC|nr:DUF1329 domain-containing protein [Sinimarinibacterium sp. CAU 1509]